METAFTFLLTAIALLAAVFIYASRRRRRVRWTGLPDTFRRILERDVPFYISLAKENRAAFEKRMLHFLNTTRITGVKTELDDADYVYLGASAIIPIFGFPWFRYNNLNEVLVYPDAFDQEFRQQGEGRHTLGVVGDGPYHRIMIISRQQLRQAFLDRHGKDNTAIHEFVHLIDKSDGTIDGIPEALLDKQYVVPWLQLMQKEIDKIFENRSDLDPYGAHSEAEFLAVASEYFFERPGLLEKKHPELYALLVKVFNQKPPRKV